MILPFLPLSPRARWVCVVGAVVLSFVSVPLCSAAGPPTPDAPLVHGIPLNGGWCVQSTELTSEHGDLFSRADFDPRGWYRATIPATVLGTLVRDSVYKDPWVGTNLARIPSTPFGHAWWFRCTFEVPEQFPEQHATLCFDGIIYRANIWVNGTKVADADTTEGVYRRFEFEVSNVLVKGRANALAVEVFPPRRGEPSVGFVDWNPPAPDADMGLWRSVRLVLSGPVTIRHPFVQARVDEGTLRTARLTVSAELRNCTEQVQQADLRAKCEGFVLSKHVVLEPREVKHVTWDAAEDPALAMHNPRLWWPHGMGEPNLYTLHLACAVHGRPSDNDAIRFGIRQVGDYLDAEGHRGFTVNGRKILIRGGGWTDDLLLDSPPEHVDAQIRYVRQMNLNAIRLEGFWGRDELFHACDEQGILVLAGLSCQWEWDGTLGKHTDPRYGGILSPHDRALVARMWKDQVLWLRSHPSILVWLYGSDKYPMPAQERTYLQILKDVDPLRPSLASAKGWVSEVSGPTGVKMLGPYEYEPPVYWFADTAKGGAYGFNTETGPGAQVPPIQSIRKMFPPDSLWPQGSVWDFHCGKGHFSTLARYNAAMDNRLGTPSSLIEYCRKAQYLNYEGMRAMFEAFAAHKYHATGVIQWMLNSAWPKLFWQLYDYYLLPNGAFYGARKAGEPLHVLYDPATRDIILVNNAYTPYRGCQIEGRVLDFDLSERYLFSASASAEPDQSAVLGRVPAISGLTRTYFVTLVARDSKGSLLSDNFYALSTHPDAFAAVDTSADSWFLTPVTQYADLTDLNGLPPVAIDARMTTHTSGGEVRMAITLENHDHGLAFQLELMVVRGKTGDPVVPIFLDDNYISLLPGERRTIDARFKSRDLHGHAPVVQVSGWNLRHVEWLKGNP
jgi:exo-1,4-beta-D-glucosaminidase